MDNSAIVSMLQCCLQNKSLDSRLTVLLNCAHLTCPILRYAADFLR